jgi:hypothetical protein
MAGRRAAPSESDPTVVVVVQATPVAAIVSSSHGFIARVTNASCGPPARRRRLATGRGARAPAVRCSTLGVLRASGARGRHEDHPTR